MSLAERLRRAYLRWSRLGVAGLLLLPIIATSLLGFLWLHERGFLLVFVLGCAGLALSVWSGRFVLRWNGRRKARAVAVDADGEGRRGGFGPARTARASRDRSGLEAHGKPRFSRLPARPSRHGSKPLSSGRTCPNTRSRWWRMWRGRMSDGKKGALDFTMPEALLLIDRVALRYREFLRSNVPFSDQLSVRAISWLWTRQDQAKAAWKYGYLAYRGLRFMFNPPVAVLRELERAATAGLQDRLTDQVMRDAQAILARGGRPGRRRSLFGKAEILRSRADRDRTRLRTA